MNESDALPRSRSNDQQVNRREFIQSTAAAACVAGAPFVWTPSRTHRQVVIGAGDYRYEVHHDCCQLPAQYSWQTTHNVAVDREGLVYVIHEGRTDLKDHPAIFVFDGEGNFVRAFGSEFQGGGHGLEARTEGSDVFLYVTGYLGLKKFSKLTTRGELVWERRAPMRSNRYAEGEDTAPANVWGRDRFMPTNIAFSEDGFFVADGYGAYCVHHYDREANYLGTFGEAGNGENQFDTPHGIAAVQDDQGALQLVIADRANHRLQWLTAEGHPLRSMGDFLLPANVDTYQELLLVPELQARVTLLHAKHGVVVRLADDAAWREAVLADNMQMRRQPNRWQPGKFIHPHDACFDNDGDIYVAEWVAGGRISKLKRLK